MSKRNYYIIIAILVALDIAAAFWYMAGHINSDGKSDFFGSNSELAMEADTISDKFVSDKFESIEYNAFYVSKIPAVGNDQTTYYTSIKRLKASIPSAINNNNDVAALVAEVANKAFPNCHGNFESGTQMFLKTPSFNVANVDYKVISSAPTIFSKYGNVQGVKIYPIFSSKNYLVMAINRSSYKGETTQHESRYVNYNRINHNIITAKDVFISNHDDKLLELVNQKIEKLISENTQWKLHKASTLSSEIYLRRTGVFFVYQPGVIAEKEDGVMEVFVNFDRLNPYLQPKFKQLIASNSNAQELKPLTFSR